MPPSIPHPPRAVKSTFLKYWFGPDAAPILGLTLGGLIGAAWFLSYSAKSSTVEWTPHSTPPYLKIQDGTNTKLMTVNVRDPPSPLPPPWCAACASHPNC